MNESLLRARDYWLANYDEDVRLVAYGMLLMLAVLFFAKFVNFIFFRKKCTGIVMRYDGGRLEITRNALEEFIIRILADRKDMTVEKVLLRERSSQYHIEVRIKIKADTHMKELRDQIVQIIREDTSERLGVERLGAVDVYLQNVNASDSKINRRHKIALHAEPEEAEEEATA